MKKLFIISSLLLLSSQLFAQKSSELKSQIEHLISSKQVTVGVSILDLESGDTLSINGNKLFPMLSVFKFHIALTVLNKVDKGELTLNDKLFINKTELLADTWSPFRDKYPDGNVSITIQEALQYTVSQSDNNLCDVLLRRIGGVKVVESFINNPNFIIHNDEEAMHQSWNAQLVNTTTPNYSVALLRKLYQNKILTAKSCEFLYNAMLVTSVAQNRIKGKLPLGAEVAHRPGTSGTNSDGLTAAINDIGIVKLPNSKHFILAIFLQNTTETFKESEEIIADISKLTWDFYSK
ncbi:class A beta-lactamase, subclass A2 [Flavobacterium sp. PL002]|uniref:class A beta-lactamase, subclass A2 n=1 Tax=Flavobacterium sp. PL002 TaxID=1897058 RepID=UPI0017878446|nr:class A beta-lactamase, subclass A2 [Flavobacterium sp. PL002]MBE0393760.1 Extended-spectrum beta-lactamase PER-1 [Flavobacterium sp. PL002]